MGIKIRNIKEIQEVKEIHNFISEQIKLTVRVGVFENFPLVETYNEMIDAFQTNSKLQIKAELAGVLIGYALATFDKETKQAWLKVIMVKGQFQKKGLAQKLLKEMEKRVKSVGAVVLKANEREGTNGFYIRSGFVPYLYVTASKKDSFEKVLGYNNERFKILEEKEENGNYFVKFDVEGEAVYYDKSEIYKLAKDVESRFVYEKRLK